MSTGAKKKRRFDRASSLELPPGFWGSLWANLQNGRVLARLAMCAAAAFILLAVTHGWAPPLGFREGDVPSRDIVVRTQFEKRDEDATREAEARARQAAIAYEQAIERAFREVSDALSNVREASDAEQDLAARVEQARNALRLATLRYEAGYSAYLEVLDAQRTLNEAQLALVRNRQAFLGFTVDLMSALGGGWTPY